MNVDALGTYLNDHLAGAMLGSDHAEQLAERFAGTPTGPAMAGLAHDIEEDRQELIGLMDRLGITRNQIKQATTWFAEKAGRVKFSGLSSGDKQLGTYMALETMSLGVEGKLSLWLALDRVAATSPELDHTALERLIERAKAQRAMLEAERLTAAEALFSGQPVVAS